LPLAAFQGRLGLAGETGVGSALGQALQHQPRLGRAQAFQHLDGAHAAQQIRGRAHDPLCYSVVLAGGGIRGGLGYRASDRIGALPADQPCEPNDLHATIFQALGIPLDATIADQTGGSFPITDGRVLPLF
jgi:Protein of unknown function (DUF1501)